MMPCFQQLLPDLVGAREILGLFGGRALRDHRLHFGIANRVRSARSGCSTSKIESNMLQKIQRRRDVAGAELARIHGAVGVAHVFENRRQRLGGIQIVVQAVGERLRRPAAVRAAICSFTPSANRSVSRRSLKLRSRSIAVAADFSPSKVKLSCLR